MFDGGRYFDVTVEYAKAGPDDVLVRITATNRGPDVATLALLPTLWFRNTWSWTPGAERHLLRVAGAVPTHATVEADHPTLGRRWLYCAGAPEMLATENETNTARLWGVPNAAPHVKDGIDNYVVHGRNDAVNPAKVGTKMAALYRLTLGPGESRTTLLRLTNTPMAREPFGLAFDAMFVQRRREADEFYAAIIPPTL